MGVTCRVLVVEDDAPVARALTRVLEYRGMEVVAANSCAAARAAGGGFDVAVCDIGLPDGDGIELARELLASGAVSVVVFHSGERSEETRLAASELGSFCDKGQGIHILHKVLLEALADCDAGARAVGAEDMDVGRDSTRFRSGKRTKLS